MTVLPRSVGTFLMSRSEISLNDAAVSSRNVNSSRRGRRAPADGGAGTASQASSGIGDDDFVLAVALLQSTRARPRPGRSAGSCRRSRRGSAVRGGRDRPARRAGRCAGGRSPSARRARRAPCGPCTGRRRRGRHAGRRSETSMCVPFTSGCWRAAAEVVPVQRDVDDPHGHVRRFNRAELRSQAFGEVNAARAHADEDQVAGPLVAFEDLVRDARQGAIDRLRVHDDAAGSGHARKKSLPAVEEALPVPCCVVKLHCFPFWPLRTSLKDVTDAMPSVSSACGEVNVRATAAMPRAITMAPWRPSRRAQQSAEFFQPRHFPRIRDLSKHPRAKNDPWAADEPIGR